MLYYETSVEHGDSILLAFQEIMARPLINEYVVRWEEGVGGVGGGSG